VALARHTIPAIQRNLCYTNEHWDIRRIEKVQRRKSKGFVASEIYVMPIVLLNLIYQSLC